MKVSELQAKAAKGLSKWKSELTVADYLKDKLGTVGRDGKTTNADQIIELAIEKAKMEERPEWTKLLFEMAGRGEEKPTVAIQTMPTINLTLNS